MKIVIALLLSVILISCTKDTVKQTDKKQDTVKTTEIKTAKDTAVKTESPAILKIRDKLVSDLLKKDLGTLTETDRKFFFAETDLNGDGKNEYFAAFSSPYFCGSGGCTAYLFDNEFNVISHFTVIDYPFYVMTEKTDGWKDLVMFSGGKNRLVKHAKGKYPGNPSTLPEFKGEPGKDAVKLFENIQKSEPVKF